MKLYSGPLSLFTAKVRIALAEKRIAYQRVEVGWSLDQRYEPHHPDVVRLNPRRQVPVLVDGDTVVCDSTVILEYLEDAYPDPPLLPRDAAGRARARRLEADADERLFPHVWPLIETTFYASAAVGRAGADAARVGVAAYYEALERELAGAYLCGAFGVADIANYVMASTAAALGAAPGAATPRVGAWLTRLRARPAVRSESDEMTAFATRALGRRSVAAATG